MSSTTLVGKIAIVTGASAGIGKAIAELLVKNGAIVAGIARRVEHVCQHAQELAGEKGSLHGYQCDLTKKDDILAAFKKINTELGPISILINNAGALKMSAKHCENMSYSISLGRFVGKVAVVTGASAGIGEAIAKLLVRNGVMVAGVARRAESVREHAKKLLGERGVLHAYQCDLTKQDEILRTFKKITTELGPISILINNAGVLKVSGIIDGDIEKWKAVIDTNVMAVATGIREAVASMKAHNIKGHIININSTAGHTVLDFPNAGFYPASKFAVTALTESVRLEINREKLPIKITSLSPGYVETDIVKVAFTEVSGSNSWEKITVKGLHARDIADAALYVLSTPEHICLESRNKLICSNPLNIYFRE
ncbi:hypothetical protein D910_10531 [Dendroctonus ponderosae]|uniref:Uncharacterized protein n=1 Tax=Dendroctonus ponderosae TaxID=77166 RepID=U4UT02_DENPD|nr:hypothetical protein D910_10531 [Dendroctonus ponderosae]